MNLGLKCLPGSAGKKENRARSMPARMIMAVFLLVIYSRQPYFSAGRSGSGSHS